MRLHRLLLVALVLCAGGTSFGQILIPDQVKPYTPIVGRCDCVIPPNSSVTLNWRADEKSNVIQVTDDKGLSNVHVWAAPGKHWLEVTVITQFFRELVVWVPDPKHPDDITKAKLEKIKITDRYDIQRYEKTYTVLGQTPGPDIDPKPDDPDPKPDDPIPTGLAGKVVGWAKDAGISKTDLSIIADNYLSVGSQGGDPARSTGWDLSAFTAKTKELNLQNIGVDKIASWNKAFFTPLATWQSETFKDRKLTTKDREKIAELWTETGEAIKTASR